MSVKNTSIGYNRKKYLPKYFVSHPSMLKSILSLQTDKPKSVCKLGTFSSKVLPLFSWCWDSILVVYYSIMVLFCVCSPHHDVVLQNLKSGSIRVI